MGIKLISREGDFLPLLHKMHQDGKEVLAYIDDDCAKNMHDNMTPKVCSPLELSLSKDDTIVFDMVHGGSEADTLKSQGFTVIGGGSFNDKIELDRDYGQSFMEAMKINTPDTIGFSSFADARKFLKDSDKRYVFKPNGNMDTDLTYVSASTEDMLRMLPYLEARCGDEQVDFDLQEFVEGVEMSTEAWFNGEKFLLPLNSTMEEKKFLTGNLGPATGCMGNVVWWWDMETSQFLYELLFKRMEPILRKERYLGPLDINALWTPGDLYALEFTARFGYDAIQAASRLFTPDLYTVLRDLPELSELPVIPDRYALSIRLSIPPYPNRSDSEDIPIPDPGSLDPFLYWSDVRRDEEGALWSASTDGYVASIAADGNSVAALQRKLYAILGDYKIPNMQYRTDIGDRFFTDFPEIKKIIEDWS